MLDVETLYRECSDDLYRALRRRFDRSVPDGDRVPNSSAFRGEGMTDLHDAQISRFAATDGPEVGNDATYRQQSTPAARWSGSGGRQRSSRCRARGGLV